ncbi:uncharacterized protein LOC120687674 [Panicum virgatum]|uniref:uncharacterized protein LOC120687674 n=1 Tax=Panicum virgatum TaxID=38727 RepID=UPI0019D663C4|nr:uncharacterized protein LOC120687674 [Panicum virgatum]
MWLEDYCLTCRAGGADDDRFIIQYLPICLGENVLAWLDFLPADSIGCWADLRNVFIGNFQGTYVRPSNSWDLKNCKQEPGESLRDYIRRFSKQCNSLPGVVDADVIGVFLSKTHCKTLVHKLGCQKPRTTLELLEIATNHASGKEVVGAVFERDQRTAKEKRRDRDMPSSSLVDRKNKKNRRPPSSGEVAVTEHQDKHPLRNDHFYQLLDKPCTNHGYLVNHKFKDCDMMKRLLRWTAKTDGDDRDKRPDAGQDKEKPVEGEFPDVDRCLVIIGGLEDECSRRLQKVRFREVGASASSIPRKLKWASTPIIFDQDDHPASVPRPGSYPLVVDPIVSNMRLSKVLMDGGSSLNILYLDTLEAMGIPRGCLRDSPFPFYGILPGMKAYPVGNIDLLVTFGSKTNFRTETLTFEVVDWKGVYHALLGRTAYAKFMAVPNYTYLQLKMPGPNRVITVSGSFE